MREKKGKGAPMVNYIYFSSLYLGSLRVHILMCWHDKKETTSQDFRTTMSESPWFWWLENNPIRLFYSLVWFVCLLVLDRMPPWHKMLGKTMVHLPAMWKDLFSSLRFDRADQELHLVVFYTTLPRAKFHELTEEVQGEVATFGCLLIQLG